MLVKHYQLMRVITATTLCLAVGCSQDVDQSDINAAREKVNQEKHETEEVRRVVQQQVAQEERETDATRHEVMKPTSEEIRDEENETAETQIEGNKKIEKEEQETREAEEELAKTEAKFKAQQARDAFLEEPNDVLKRAALRIDTLEEQADSEEGDAKKATEKQIETLQASHDKLDELIDETKSANPLNWQEIKPEVEVAQKELQNRLKDAKID
jgi:hypothetical protein